MGWSFEITGHPKAVTAAVEKRKVSGDQSQLDMIKAFVKHELSFHTANRGGGVMVRASGHHGPEGRSLNITVQPAELALDDS